MEGRRLVRRRLQLSRPRSALREGQEGQKEQKLQNPMVKDVRDKGVKDDVWGPDIHSWVWR